MVVDRWTDSCCSTPKRPHGAHKGIKLFHVPGPGVEELGEYLSERVVPEGGSAGEVFLGQEPGFLRRVSAVLEHRFQVGGGEGVGVAVEHHG